MLIGIFVVLKLAFDYLNAFATFTSPKMHLVCPPQFCISIVFNFSWVDCNTQEMCKWRVR